MLLYRSLCFGGRLAGVGTLILFGLGVLLVAGLSRDPEDRIKSLVHPWMAALGKVLALRINTHGELAADTRLLAANHISWLDIVVIGSLFSSDFVAKEEVAHWPVIGALARSAGTLFVARKQRASRTALQHTVKAMAERLQRGRLVTIFPEGTTSDGKQLRRFSPRLFSATDGVHPVQAIALRYGGKAADTVPFIGDDAFVPHLLRLLWLATIPVELQLSPVFIGGDHLACQQWISERLGLAPSQ